MGINLQSEKGNIAVLRITDLLKKAEFDALQTVAGKHMKPTDSFKLLILLTNFKGWEKAEGWGDLTFFSKHGDKITKNRNRWRPQMGNRIQDVCRSRLPCCTSRILQLE